MSDVHLRGEEGDGDGPQPGAPLVVAGDDHCREARVVQGGGGQEIQQGGVRDTVEVPADQDRK